MSKIVANEIVVRYIYSACVVTETPDVKILHDPWFTEGIYDGSWYHFPKLNNPIEQIGDVDAIYISHVHPDHYDSKFIKSYFEVFGEKEIIISNLSPNHLANKMRADGFSPRILKEEVVFGDTRISIIPHDTGSVSDIDSAIIIKYSDGIRDHCVLNVNDIVFEDKMLSFLVNLDLQVDILLCGYTGAGPYPQTYFNLEDPQILIEAEKKKTLFFERYKKLINAIKAKVVIPFAGKYILGGHLSPLNEFRGVADAIEVLEFDKTAVVLDDGGDAWIGTSKLTPSRIRTKEYSKEELRLRQREIENIPMAYERLMPLEEVSQLPFKRLLRAAAKNANLRSECETDYYFLIELPGGEFVYINANKSAEEYLFYTKNKNSVPIPRSEIAIDPRYLFGLLTHIYHWNNAEVGSQVSVRRFPNEFNRGAQSFLNFLVV